MEAIEEWRENSRETREEVAGMPGVMLQQFKASQQPQHCYQVFSCTCIFTVAIAFLSIAPK